MPKKNEEHIREAIAANLKAYRKKNDKSQEQMARKLGIKQRRYAKYEEAAVTPPFSLIIRMAEILTITVNELTGMVKIEKV